MIPPRDDTSRTNSPHNPTGTDPASGFRWRRSPSDISRRDVDPARLDRPDLDAPTQVLVQPGRRMPRRHLDGLVQEVAPELFLGLGIGAVRDGDLAVARPQAHGIPGGGEGADLEQATAPL